MKSLSDLWAESREEEFEAKVAAVTEAWGEDEVRVELLDQAVDLIKEATEEGLMVELDACDTFTLAANVVEDMLKEAAEELAEEDLQKEASDEEMEELTKEAEAEYEALGQLVGDLLNEHGLDVDDLEKVASEEDLEELGRWAANELLARCDAE